MTSPSALPPELRGDPVLGPPQVRDPRASPWALVRQGGPWMGEAARLQRSVARAARLLRAARGRAHVLWYSALPEHRALVFACAQHSGQSALWGPWPAGLCTNWTQVSGSLQAHRRGLPWRGAVPSPRLARLHRRWRGWHPRGERPDLVIALHPRGTEVLRREAHAALVPTVGWGAASSASLAAAPWTYPLWGSPESLPQVYAVARLLARAAVLE
eukprot:scaffold3008_cov1771-Pavlova_lutheri.AAC.8